MVSADNRSRVYYDPASGRLTLSDANATVDTGLYVCALNLTTGCRRRRRDGDATWRRCNATLDCRVYVMPDYVADGVAVAAVNGLLVVVLVACCLHSVVADRRRRRRRQRTDQHDGGGLQKLRDER